MNIRMCGVYVDDPAKAFKFYTETLGFKELMFMPEASIAIVTAPDQPDGTALLLEPNNNPIAKSYQEALFNAGIPVIVFGSDDAHKEYERLRALGVAFKSAPTLTDYGIVAQFDDTCGNYIQLHQHA